MNDLPPEVWADMLEDNGQDTSLLRSVLSYDIAQQGKLESLYRAGQFNGSGSAFAEDSACNGWGCEWPVGNDLHIGHGPYVGVRGVANLCEHWGDA